MTDEQKIQPKLGELKRNPRIYTYKITFADVPYYYYGLHKEKKFNEYYMGRPVTHRWCWEMYEPKKQILELFEYSDNGWLRAQEVEKRIIKPFYNTDKWCLNENCGGNFSLGTSRKTVLKQRETGTGLFGLTKEQRSETSKKSYSKHKETGTGLFGLTKEQRSEIAIKNALKQRETGTAIFGISKEQRSEMGRKASSQRWQCTETGFITNAGNLSRYQRARGIDTSKRIRLS